MASSDSELSEHLNALVATLNIKTTQETLNRLLFLLSFGSLKSHQAAFDLAYDELVEAKKLRSWKVITACINENTPLNLSEMTVKTMFKRAKRKHS